MTNSTTPALKFATVDAPKPQRQPNPFDDVFPTAEGKAIALTLPGLEDADDDNGKAIRRVVKQARDAANAKDKSVTITRTVGGTKAKPETTLTFMTRKLITRPRKSEAKEQGAS